jgi:hypothetical protein
MFLRNRNKKRKRKIEKKKKRRSLCIFLSTSFALRFFSLDENGKREKKQQGREEKKSVMLVIDRYIYISNNNLLFSRKQNIFSTSNLLSLRSE